MLWRLLRVLALAVLSADAVLAADLERRWAPLANDGVHDPASPALGLLQEPREALLPLPPDTAGNQVNWSEALDKGSINPRTNVNPETKVRIRETEILLNQGGSTPMVRFPHRQHTLWLDCSNCHEHLFKSKAGATRFSMEQILQGEQCGVCHGAVAFPLTECNRCHSVSQVKPAPARSP